MGRILKARTYTSTDCPHVDQVHSAVEVGQTSVDVVEFKPAVGGYVVLVHDPGSQVGADDFNMRVLEGHSSGPKRRKIVTSPKKQNQKREVVTKYHSHTLNVGRR